MATGINQEAYLCRACDVYGAVHEDVVPRCWLCGGGVWICFEAKWPIGKGAGMHTFKASDLKADVGEEGLLV